MDDIKPLPPRAQTRGGIVRPGSASGPKAYGNKAAFGRSFSNSNMNAEIGAKQNSSRIQPLGGLNKNALNKLNHLNKNTNKMTDVEEQIVVNNENKNDTNQLPPRTPNYGKTPKYLEKFKE